MSNEESLDKLYEALTINHAMEDARSPPQGGWGLCGWWGGYTWKCKTGKDIVYRNNEGLMHRVYGPAYVSTVYDVEIWYKDGKYHREDGPAIRHKNNALWYVDGKRHRLDGPAVVQGGGPKEFWIDGQKLPPKEYKKEIERRRRRGLIK